MSTQGNIFLSHVVGLRHAKRGTTATPRTVGKLLRALGLLLLLWPVSAQAATLFDIDFESGSTACDWTANLLADFGAAPCGGVMLMTTAKAFTGTHSLGLTYATLDNTHCITPCPSVHKSPSAPSPFTPQTDMFIRFAIQVSSDFSISVNNTKLIKMQGGSVFPRAWISLNSGTYQFRMEGPFDGGNQYIFDTGIAPRRNQWDQVEVEWKLNTCGVADGSLTMWVNGGAPKTVTGRAWRGNGANSTGLVSNCSSPINDIQVYLQNGSGTTCTPGCTGHLYYDRIAGGNSRIGLVSGSPPPPPLDTTPPSPPTCAQIGTPCP